MIDGVYTRIFLRLAYYNRVLSLSLFLSSDDDCSFSSSLCLLRDAIRSKILLKGYVKGFSGCLRNVSIFAEHPNSLQIGALRIQIRLRFLFCDGNEYRYVEAFIHSVVS